MSFVLSSFVSLVFSRRFERRRCFPAAAAAGEWLSFVLSSFVSSAVSCRFELRLCYPAAAAAAE